MASKIKVDQIEGSTASTITIPTGQTFTVTDGIPVASGGTGLASFTAGDILYATGATTLTKLGKGTAEQVLAMNTGATAPDWGSVDLTVLPTITVAKGGTNLSSFTAGDILYATGATTLAKLAKGSGSQTLKMNSGATAPEWATVAAASSDFVKVGTVAGTGASGTMSIDECFSATYRSYTIHAILYNTSSSINRFRVRTGGASGSDETGSVYTNVQNTNDMSSSTATSNAAGEYQASNWSNGGTPTADSDRPTNVHVTIFDPFDSARDTCAQGIWSLYDGTRFKWAGNALTYMTSESITGFTFYTDSGNFESHSIITVWGLKS